MAKRYIKLTFTDGSLPALNATNLNAISTALDECDTKIEEINSNLIKVFTKEYTVTSSSTIDGVTGLYTAGIDISVDKPVGAIISCFAQSTALQAYFSLGAIVSATTNGNDVRVGTLVASRTVVVQVTWLYK